MKEILSLCFFALGLAPGLNAGADPIDTVRTGKLVHAIVDRLEQQSAAFPILAELLNGKYAQNPNLVDFDSHKLTSMHEIPRNPCGPQPQTNSYEVVDPGGIHFHLYVAPHSYLMESTKIFRLSGKGEAPVLVYFFSTNPPDLRLQAAVKTCVENQLLAAGYPVRD